MLPSAKENWLDAISAQVKFNFRRRGKTRNDTEDDWKWFERVSAYRKIFM